MVSTDVSVRAASSSTRSSSTTRIVGATTPRVGMGLLGLVPDRRALLHERGGALDPVAAGPDLAGRGPGLLPAFGLGDLDGFLDQPTGDPHRGRGVGRDPLTERDRLVD